MLKPAVMPSDVTETSGGSEKPSSGMTWRSVSMNASGPANSNFSKLTSISGFLPARERNWTRSNSRIEHLEVDVEAVERAGNVRRGRPAGLDRQGQVPVRRRALRNEDRIARRPRLELRAPLEARAQLLRQTSPLTNCASNPACTQHRRDRRVDRRGGFGQDGSRAGTRPGRRDRGGQIGQLGLRRAGAATRRWRCRPVVNSAAIDPFVGSTSWSSRNRRSENCEPGIRAEQRAAAAPCRRRASGPGPCAAGQSRQLVELVEADRLRRCRPGSGPRRAWRRRGRRRTTRSGPSCRPPRGRCPRRPDR